MEPVRNILSDKGRELFFIGSDATVLKAVELMCDKRVGALLVQDAGAPIGMFSERDVMTRVVLARRDPSSTRVGDVMTRDVVVIKPETSTTEAMALMTSRRCRHLPVVESGRVIGLVSIGDLVRAASREREFEIQLLHDYITGKYPG
jgi:CBS domain-containing protein